MRLAPTSPLLARPQSLARGGEKIEADDEIDMDDGDKIEADDDDDVDDDVEADDDEKESDRIGGDGDVEMGDIIDRGEITAQLPGA